MSAYFPDDEAIHRHGLALLDLSLPKGRWTHAGHFAAALWLLRARPDIDAGAQMPGIIRAYNVATGVANTDSGGYHETITQASLRAARVFLAERAETPLYQVIDALMASPLGRPDWLLAYWGRETLFSVQARRVWVEPDIRSLPF